MEASYWQSPVLQSVIPVVAKSRHVRTVPEAVEAVAGWMAYEEFHLPEGAIVGPFDLGSDPDMITDLTMVLTAMDFAFTDFDTSTVYEVAYMGKVCSDAEAMFARMHEALAGGVPLLDGEFLAGITRADLERIFRGNIEMPLLDERVVIFHEIGEVLADRYEGRFHRFVAGCPPAMYAEGEGLVERLAAEFPRFNDVSLYDGAEVKIMKLAQLGLWSLHAAHHASGHWSLTDLGDMTAFADYIVPGALQLMGILEYTPDLYDRIQQGVMIERDSEEEVELRAHTVYATARLTDAINRIRPPERQLVIPQVDYRFWKTYHTHLQPHHLTRTIMY